TSFETEEGAVSVIDCMPQSTAATDLVRMVVGRRGQVPMRTEICIRFDYGATVPWVRRLEGGGISAVAGPDMLRIRTPVRLRGQNFKTLGRFTVSAGERVPFVLTWHPSHLPPPPEIDPERALAETAQAWLDWSRRSTFTGPWREAVV